MFLSHPDPDDDDEGDPMDIDIRGPAISPMDIMPDINEIFATRIIESNALASEFHIHVVKVEMNPVACMIQDMFIGECQRRSSPGLTLLFHGTRVNILPLIFSDGFRPGGEDGVPMTHGNMVGHGIYLATLPAMAHCYVKQRQASTYYQMVICIAIVNSRHVKRFTGKVPTLSTKAPFYVVKRRSYILPVAILSYTTVPRQHISSSNIMGIPKQGSLF